MLLRPSARHRNLPVHRQSAGVMSALHSMLIASSANLCCLLAYMELTTMLTGNSAGLASGGNLSAEPRRGITKDSVFPDPVAAWMTASLWLFRILVALFCTSAEQTGTLSSVS